MNYQENLVRIRRELHKIPEMGWGEFKTTAKIIEALDPMGWTLHTGIQQVGK